MWHYTFVYIFANFWPILKIFPLAHSADNLQYCAYNISHHTTSASLHNVVKYKCKQKLMTMTKKLGK